MRSTLWAIATHPPFLVILGTVAFTSWAIAVAAPNPKAETLLLGTQTSKEANKPSHRCLQATTIQRFSVKPDGKMEYLGGFTMWTACQK